MTIINVTEADFEREVIERSDTIPVVVDFWAQWCGPCRQLTPLLERAAGAREGKVVLAKLDTDANPNLARSFQIQGIPAVKAIRERRLHSEFVGAQSAAVVERFFDSLLPSEADLLIASGSEEDLRRALELEPGRAQAAVPLARLLIGRGESEQALLALRDVTGSFQADGLRARVKLEQQGACADALVALQQPDLPRAFELLLLALNGNAEWREDIRQLIVGELDALGAENPLASDVRRRLASALY